MARLPVGAPSSKGKTPDSDSVNRGSNPRGASRHFRKIDVIQSSTPPGRRGDPARATQMYDASHAERLGAEQLAARAECGQNASDRVLPRPGTEFEHRDALFGLQPQGRIAWVSGAAFQYARLNGADALAGIHEVSEAQRRSRCRRISDRCNRSVCFAGSKRGRVRRRSSPPSTSMDHLDFAISHVPIVVHVVSPRHPPVD